VCGIPDFRLEPDPYISLEDDRRKGEALFIAGRSRTFESLLRHYYAVTPEDPPDLAERWTARALREVEIADGLLREAGLHPSLIDASANASDGRALLDVGCSTGALLIAARRVYSPLVGVDVAFRWLVVGQRRLEEAGVTATLVCANAESLPFDANLFDVITATDVIEHVRDAAAALSEAARAARPGARLAATANNRYAPTPEPNVHLWGVGFLPRPWQAKYVSTRRGDLHPYRIRLYSAREVDGLMKDAGWRDIQVAAAPLAAPHASRAVRSALRIYNRMASFAPSARILTLTAPRLLIRAVR
jgi:ubiquinone/menaquinone biosynthesis C-methylase UbiE